MSSLTDILQMIKPRPPAVPLTARQVAEGWIHALRGDEPVEAAEADAEDEFRTKELAARWRESCDPNGFLRAPEDGPQLPHWKAGAEYAKRMFLGYAEAVAERIKKPRDYESFLHESVAILAERTYRQKLQPYDQLASEEAVGRAIIRFHEFVRTVVAEDLSKVAHKAWRRHKERCQRKSISGTASSDEAASKPETIVAQPAVIEPNPKVVQLQPGDATDAVPDAKTFDAKREALLQEFLQRNNTSVAAVCRAARVAKADLLRWRHGQMKSTSVMAIRIESVLSGRTPLLPKDLE